MSANRPVHEVRFGHVKAAIWANDVDGFVRHNVTLQRLYKDGDEWKTSQSFGRDDLPLLMKVLDRAHSFCYEQSQEVNGSRRHEEELPY